MRSIDMMIHKWRTQNVSVNPPAKESDLIHLQQILGTILPADVRYYFSVANGVADGAAVDPFLTTFWPISEIAAVSQEFDETPRHTEYRDFAFADVMLSSWFISFRVRSNGQVTVYVQGASLELPSLEAFFEQYLAQPELLSL
jgi:hypothetical protein